MRLLLHLVLHLQGYNIWYPIFINLLFQAEEFLQFINFGIYLLYWYKFTSLNMIYLQSVAFKTNISTGICIKCLILSQHEKGKYHSLTYKIETAKVIFSHDPISTGKKYILNSIAI